MRNAAVCTLIAAAIWSSVAIGADAHIGFEIKAIDGKYPEVTKVYAGTDAQQMGIRPGLRIVSVGGGAVKDEKALARRLSKKKPGDPMVVKFKFNDEEKSVPLTLAPTADIDAANAAERAAKASAQRVRDAEDKLLAAMDKMNELHGGAIAQEGKIMDDAIGKPMLVLTVCNVSEREVDAIEVRVEMFDKFDRPVEGEFGESHDRKALYQTPIPPRSFKELELRMPFHRTTGKARVSVTKYLTTGGKPVDVERPYVIVVER